MNITVYGDTLDEIMAKALAPLKAFFGSTPFEILEVRAEPHLQTMGGDILGWRGEVEAGETWMG